jgi:uroporphyrinogen-III decarboxylase
LQTIVVQTEDWPYDQDVHLFDDYNIPRLKEPLIKDEKDIPCLKYLLGEPTEQQLIEFRERARYLREQAERLGVLLDGGWSALGDAVMWLCGMERVLYGQMDCPQFIEKVLDTVFEWEMRRIDWLLEEGIDVMVHMAWYEGTDFWTPKNYRKMLKPRLMAMIEKVHAHGVKFRYIISRGWKPLMKDFLEMGIDCLAGVDPVQDKIDLREIKREIGGQICLMGGLNSAVMLNLWSEEQIRNAVREAVEILSPGGGAILFPVDAVFNNTPWEKVEILIDQWRSMW